MRRDHGVNGLPETHQGLAILLGQWTREFDHRAMEILAQRQQLSRLQYQCADTPNFKARDFDLRAALPKRPAAIPGSAALPMSTSSRPASKPGSVQQVSELWP